MSTQTELDVGIPKRIPEEKKDLHVQISIHAYTITQDSKFCKDTFKNALIETGVLIMKDLETFSPLKELVKLRTMTDEERLATLSRFFNSDI